jgi:hypothetical protein
METPKKWRQALRRSSFLWNAIKSPSDMMSGLLPLTKSM